MWLCLRDWKRFFLCFLGMMVVREMCEIVGEIEVYAAGLGLIR